MADFDKYRHNAAAFDAGLAVDCGLNLSGFIISAFFIDEIASCSAEVSEFSGFIHAYSVIGTDKGFTVDLCYFKDFPAVQLRCGNGRRSQIQNPLAGRVFDSIILFFFIIIQAQFITRQQITDSLIRNIRR